MICQKCNNPGVLNSVLNKEFYYCRTCKDEINLSQDFTEGTLFKARGSYETYWQLVGKVSPAEGPTNYRRFCLIEIDPDIAAYARTDHLYQTIVDDPKYFEQVL